MKEFYIAEHVFHDAYYAKIARIAKECDAQMALTYLAATYAANMLNQVITTGLYMSIHSASPGTNGANELLAGTAYSGSNRPAISWGSISSGVVVSNDVQTYTLIGTLSGGIPYFGLWTAGSSGTYLFGGATSGLSSSLPNGAVITFTDSVTLTQAG